MIALHESGSNNPVGVTGNLDRLAMHPYFIFKDLVTIVAFFLVLSLFVFYAPNVLGHSDNYIPANPMQTPASIVPEWYLLPFYAILRSIPNKLLGVLAMIAAILVLFLMPIVDLSRLRGNAFKPFSKIAFAIFAVNFLLLMWLGSQHVESPYVEIGQICTAYYFAHFLIIIPAVSVFENTLMDIALSENSNRKTTNAINLNPRVNTLMGNSSSFRNNLNDLKGVRSYSKSKKTMVKALTYYKLIVKEFLVSFFKEIKSLFLNPLTSLKKFYLFIKDNIKYIYIFKNFYLSLMIAGFTPKIASWLTLKATEVLESANPVLSLFWITILMAYFFFFLAFYHSVIATIFAFTKGSVIQKTLAGITLINTSTSIFCILGHFIPFSKVAEAITAHFTVEAASSTEPFRAPSPGVDPFNDSTGRAGYQPAPKVAQEVAAAANSARDVMLAKSSTVEQLIGATGAGKLAYNAALNGNKKSAVFFGTVAGVSSMITTSDLIQEFKSNYDENMKKSQ